MTGPTSVFGTLGEVEVDGSCGKNFESVLAASDASSVLTGISLDERWCCRGAALENAGDRHQVRRRAYTIIWLVPTGWTCDVLV